MKYSVVLNEVLNEQLIEHLIRQDGQEDLCFALYNPSTGKQRLSAVIKEIIFPLAGERQVHGNVSFNPEYYDRVCQLALEKGCGICFMHSHPYPGWQDMSRDDIRTEKLLAPRVKSVTGLPFLGMTTGNDQTWSARFWIKTAAKKYSRKWCSSVRVTGKAFRIFYDDRQLPKPVSGKEFVRTISAWGEGKQADIARLHVGIVGLGSVGSVIAETLIKTGIRQISLIDFDLVEQKNLDRLQGVGRKSIGKLKVKVINKRLEKQKLFKGLVIHEVPFSIIEKEGLQHALDCDILFSCVDRPWPRYVLDIISFANCIPIIDGGIEAAINKRGNNMDYARWKAHCTGPGRICMKCLGQYKPEDVSLEQSGLLEDPTYIQTLEEDHFSRHGENVFAFSLGIAGMEMAQFLSLVVQPRGQYQGPKEYDFNSGNIDYDFDFQCKKGCKYPGYYGDGDKKNSTLTAEHPIAEEMRKRAKK